MTSRFALPAFAAYGIELEYMIVDATTLDVAPIAEPLLAFLEDRRSPPIGLTGWSNELASHVVELKNPEPTPSLHALPSRFQHEVRAANRALERFGAKLLPSGMHPWMNPRHETTIWSASDAAIYAAYDRLFDCRRHGWANVQSMHVNLPFAGDRQFARLHTAIRLVLPLVPALASSSPFAGGRSTGYCDYRLAEYASHMSRFPAATGEVIPDVAWSRRDYEKRVLTPMYDQMAEADPAGILRHEWLNARGAIARFDRSAIEIRLADVQECPRADIAIADAMSAVVRSLYEERRSGEEVQAGIETLRLARLLRLTMRDGADATIDDAGYLFALGVPGSARSAGELWRTLVAYTDPTLDRESRDVLAFILDRGTLARRLLRRLGDEPDRSIMREVYGELAGCLDQSRLFE